MDTTILALLIPVLALATGLVAVLRMPRGAFGHRPRPEVDGPVQHLEEEVASLRPELFDVQERLDFAERVLARTKEARPVGTSG